MSTEATPKATAKSGKSGRRRKDRAERRSSEDLLEHYLSVASKLSPDEVQVCRADTRLASANVCFAVDALFGPVDKPKRKARVRLVHKALPKLRLKRVLALPDLARALVHAADKGREPAPEEHLAPANGEAKEAEKQLSGADLRDRLWTLLVQRYSDVRAIAYYFYRDAFEGYAPKLDAPRPSARPEKDADKLPAGDDGELPP